MRFSSQISTPTQPRLETVFREYAQLEPIVGLYRKYRVEIARRNEALSILKETTDPDLSALAREEDRLADDAAQRLRENIESLLYTSDVEDNGNAVIEITAGVGGDEACIFAGELYRMYEHYVKSQGWSIDLVDFNGGKQGGIKSLTFTVEGSGAYGKLRYESGVHRVQRFSKTKAEDQMHTSAAAVVVFPEVAETDTSLNSEDVTEEFIGSSGPGGQNANKGTACVRLIHNPTGISVKCQDERSLGANRRRAWKTLASRVADHLKCLAEQTLGSERKSLRGRGSRCEKIRTYNYPQDRVTDHRIDLTLHGLDKILDGDLDPVVQKLAEHARSNG